MLAGNDVIRSETSYTEQNSSKIEMFKDNDTGTNASNRKYTFEETSITWVVSCCSGIGSYCINSSFMLEEFGRYPSHDFHAYLRPEHDRTLYSQRYLSYWHLARASTSCFTYD